MVNRFREERGHGLDVHAAAERTVATAGTTVLFSALTVAVAMSGLFVFGIPLLSSFGIAGLGVVLLCMIAAITLLPAVLAAVGHRIKPLAPTADEQGRFYRLARWVQGHAVAVGVLVTIVLIALGLPFLSARFENGDARTLPRSSEVRETALLLAERFPARGTDPVIVVADADTDSPEFETWFAAVNAREQVVGSSIHPGIPGGRPSSIWVPSGTSQGDAARGLVEQLRTERPSFPTQVGGPAAELIDVKDILSSRLPWAALMVILATLVLLFLMTGSVIVPIKAVFMNVLSLTASFGAMVWIFQDGNLSGLLRFDSVGVLDLSMPVLILIFAFGLSMDYEVFLLSRIKEVHDRDRRQRPRRRRRPATQRQDHHLRGAAHRHRLHRVRRRRGTRHQAAGRRARHRGHHRRHPRALPARARDHEAARRTQLVGTGTASAVPRPVRIPRSPLIPDGICVRRR